MLAPSRAPVAGSQQPLVTSTALQSVVCGGVPGLLGYPDPGPMPRRFRRTVVVFHRHRCPASRDAGCILSWASFVFRVPSCNHLSVRSRARTPPVGSRPSSRHRHVESTFAGFPSQLGSAHSVSHALDGLLLLVSCASVSLRYRVQGSRSRGLLPPARPYRLSATITLAPLTPSACRLPGASERRVDLRVVLPSRVRGVRPAD